MSFTLSTNTLQQQLDALLAHEKNNALAQERTEAFNRFSEHGFPTRKTEKWKYTSLHKLLDTSFSISNEQPSGNTAFTHKTNDPLADLAVAMRSNTQQIDIDTDGKQCIDLALADNQHQTLHRIIRVGENVKATIDLSYTNADNTACFANCLTEIFLAEGASLTLNKSQQLNAESFLFDHIYVSQQQQSELISFNLDLGAAIARTDMQITLKGESATCHLSGFYQGQGTQHIDNYACINHAVANCESSQIFKGILDDKAHAVFNGKVIFAKDAQKSVTEQLNQNILLSKFAEIDTKPELEIYADDVKASHGATVGQLDESALFYLQARGIDKDSAKDMLIAAFAKQVFDRIQDTDTRQLMLKQANLHGEQS